MFLGHFNFSTMPLCEFLSQFFKLAGFENLIIVPLLWDFFGTQKTTNYGSILKKYAILVGGGVPKKWYNNLHN